MCVCSESCQLLSSEASNDAHESTREEETGVCMLEVIDDFIEMCHSKRMYTLEVHAMFKKSARMMCADSRWKRQCGSTGTYKAMAR